MITHEHRMPATAEEWADAWAATFGREFCTRCLGPLTPVLSITSAMDIPGCPPSLSRLLRGIRREYGPWACVALCTVCPDVAVWPISVEDRQALVDRLISRGR